LHIKSTRLRADTSVSNRDTASHNRMPIEARSAPQKLSGKYLQGYATRFGLPHIHDGQIEMFTAGAFARALSSKAAVRFLIDHDESKLIATAADRLELLGCEAGLAFRLHLRPDFHRLAFPKIASGLGVASSGRIVA
jgi:phage head maturation protease